MVAVVALVEFSAVRMSDLVSTRSWRRRGQIGKIGLLRLQQVAELGRFLSLQGNRRRGIANGSLAALPRQAEPGGRRKGILFLLQELLVLSLPRTNLGAQGVADLVAGGDDGDFFPHAVLVFEEAAARIVNDGDNGLGHLHLFLLAGGNVVSVGKICQHVLKGLVSGMARADPGLAAENVFRSGDLDADDGNWFRVIVLVLFARRGVLALLFSAGLLAFGVVVANGGVHGNVSRQFRCDEEGFIRLIGDCALRRNNRRRVGGFDDIGVDVISILIVHNIWLLALKIKVEVVEHVFFRRHGNSRR